MKNSDFIKSRERQKKYATICERANNMGIIKGDVLRALMDIESADKKFDLQLDEFATTDDANFASDFIGIQKNIIRDTYPKVDFGFFVPKFAGNQA